MTHTSKTETAAFVRRFRREGGSYRRTRNRPGYLPPLSTNMAERATSPRYSPAPCGDRQTGERLNLGYSPTQDARIARKQQEAVERNERIAAREAARANDAVA